MTTPHSTDRQNEIRCKQEQLDTEEKELIKKTRAMIIERVKEAINKYKITSTELESALPPPRKCKATG